MKGYKLKYLIIASLILVACARPNPISPEEDRITEVQICHNPESLNHGDICNLECFEPNLDEYSFCWTLTTEDCLGPHTHDWQQKNCHFLIDRSDNIIYN